MKVCVIGLGYIGFPTACVMARAGHKVVGVDINKELITKLKNGGLHIVNENGLSELAHDAIESGHLVVSNVPEQADVFVIAVPTPFKVPTAQRATDCWYHADKAVAEVAAIQDYPVADLRYVEEATRSIAPLVKKGDLIILESTVTPGTTSEVVCGTLALVTGRNLVEELYVVHAPERVLPGNIVYELVHNDRIVGGVTEAATEVGVAFYRTFVEGEVIGTDATTAELVKLMENTFRDVNIALANEFALICEKLGVNAFEAIRLANRHPRVEFLTPGPGVGGHCIAVDPHFVVQAAPREARLIRLARQINSRMPDHVMELFRTLVRNGQEIGRSIRSIGLLGASYKANVGDERESPALQVAHRIASDGYRVTIHDPYVDRFSAIPLRQVVSASDLLVLLTDHEVYRQQCTPEQIAEWCKGGLPLILDTRGFCGREWDANGFRVLRLGVG